MQSIVVLKGTVHFRREILRLTVRIHGIVRAIRRAVSDSLPAVLEATMDCTPSGAIFNSMHLAGINN